jgi:hypothetical protein
VDFGFLRGSAQLACSWQYELLRPEAIGGTCRGRKGVEVMFATTDGTLISLPFGLEFVLVLAALSFVALIACVMPIAFEMRRQLMKSSRMAEKMRGRIDSLFDECQRAVRKIGDLASRTTTAKTPLDRYL